jgi:hypothetical protein
LDPAKRAQMYSGAQPVISDDGGMVCFAIGDYLDDYGRTAHGKETCARGPSNSSDSRFIQRTPRSLPYVTSLQQQKVLTLTSEPLTYENFDCERSWENGSKATGLEPASLGSDEIRVGHDTLECSLGILLPS